MEESKNPLAPIEQKDERLFLHIVYGSFAAGFFTLISPLAGLIIAYIKREDFIGTLYESHIIWAIRTFWIGLILTIVIGSVALLFTLTILLAPIGVFLGLLVSAWFIYRIARGWIRLTEQKPILNPTYFF